MPQEIDMHGRIGGLGEEEEKTIKNRTMYILAFYFKRRETNSVCQSILLQAPKYGSKVLWVNMTSGRERGKVSRERSDMGHLRNNSSCWNFQSGKVVVFP